MVVMSLSAHERQALDAIEKRLAGSDPELASLLAMFTRLTSGEKMPAGANPAGRRQLPRISPHCSARRLCLRIGWQRAMPLLWLLTAVALIATAVALSGGGARPACTQPLKASGAIWEPAHCAGHGQRPGPGADRWREISLGASR